MIGTSDQSGWLAEACKILLLLLLKHLQLYFFPKGQYSIFSLCSRCLCKRVRLHSLISSVFEFQQNGPVFRVACIHDTLNSHWPAVQSSSVTLCTVSCTKQHSQYKNYCVTLKVIVESHEYLYTYGYLVVHPKNTHPQ